MRQFVVRFILLPLIVTGAGVLSIVGATSHASADSAFATFSGVLETSLGQPVPGVSVSLGSNSAITAADGSFTVSAVPGVYTLDLFRSPAQGPQPAELPTTFSVGGPSVDLTQGNVTQSITLPVAAVNVTVQDSSGNPVAGASLAEPNPGGVSTSFNGYPGGAFTGTVVQGGTANSSGVASYPSFLGTSAYTATLIGPGGSPTSKVSIPAVTTDPTSTTVTLASSATATFSGVLETSLGQPVPGVSVSLGSNSAITAADGSFTVSAVPGVYTLTLARSPGLGTVPAELPTRFSLGGPSVDLTQGNVTQNITLPVATVNVTVLDSSGNPVSGAGLAEPSPGGVSASFDGYPGGAFTGNVVQGGTSNTSGVASYPSFLGTSAYTATLIGPGGSPTSKVSIPAVTTDPTSATVTLASSATATFSGVLETSLGQPVPGISVSLGSNSAITAADGSFTVSAVPGVYTLTLARSPAQGRLPAELPNQFTVGGPSVDLTQGNVTQNITLPVATVNVTVLDSSGNPVAGASVIEPSEPGVSVSFNGYPGGAFTGNVVQGGTANTSGVASYPSFLGTSAYTATLIGPGGSPVIKVNLPAVTTNPINATVYLEPPQNVGTTTSITSVSPSASVANQPFTVNVAVAPVSGTLLPSGTVTVSDGGAGTCIATLSPGTGAAAGTAVGSCQLTESSAGPYTLTASYAAQGGFAASASAGTSVTVAPAPPTCTTTITSNHSGQLTVTSGDTCLVNVTQNGSVTVAPGASLTLTHATINGTVTATSAASITYCGVTESGSLNITGTTGAVTLGGTLPGGTACAADTIPSLVTISGAAGLVTVTGLSENGTLTLSGNTGGVTLNGIKLSGLAYVQNNAGTAPVTVTANKINGSLYCTGNTPVPGDSGTVNTVSGTATGQCAALATR